MLKIIQIIKEKAIKIINYFTDGLFIVLVLIPNLLYYLIRGIIVIISAIPKLLYYYFYGLLLAILSVPNFIIGRVHKRNGYTKLRRVEVSSGLVSSSVLVTFVGIYFVCIFFLSRYYVQQERIKKFSKSLVDSTEIINDIESNYENEYNPSNDIKTEDIAINYTYNYLDYLDVNVNNYTYLNDDMVGWLKVDGTSINISVVQTTDNDYYLENDLYKKKSLTGWVFADYRNNFSDFNMNTIIYGHNMANGTMFGTMYKVNNSNWLNSDKYHYIKFNTKNKKTIWQVFSVYTIDPVVDYLQVKFESDNSYNNFLNKMKSRSIHDFGVDLSSNDKILTLQTCDATGNKRLVIQAKLYKIEDY